MSVASAREYLEKIGNLGKYYKITMPDANYAVFHYMNGSQIVVEKDKKLRTVSLFSSYGDLIESVTTS